MNKDQIKKRIEKLKQLIDEYRYEYHVNDRSIMSDEAADSLKHELHVLEQQNPELITPDSPSQRVAGKPLDKFKSLPHKHPMLSLNDVFDEGELKAWQARVQKLAPNKTLDYFADIKMDGLACSLVYQDGVLTNAITRGNGQVGEDVTSNVKVLQTVPLSLHKDAKFSEFLRGRTEVRGEIVMYKKDFEALNEARVKQNLPVFANPRNLAAGTIRQLDAAQVVARPLKFRAYDLIRDNINDVLTNAFCYRALAALGFLVNKDAPTFKNIDEILKFADAWESKRNELPYNTDGLVIKLNDRILFSQLGVVGKTPRGAVALKYPAEQSTTKVKDIFVSIGRTGAATPVAMLEPVRIAGSTVQMATLHNEGEVHRKDVRVGDTVVVQKAGDIIPEVVEPITKLRTGAEQKFVMPKNCPECDTPLQKTKAEDAIWRCVNAACPARVHNQIGHFCSKAALDIDGMGEKNVLALLDAGIIKDAADLYVVTEDQLLKLERFAAVSAKKLVDAIAQKKNPKLHNFLYGLGIRHVGAQTALDLAKHFKTLDALKVATIDELRVVDGIGEVVAESVVAWFAEDQHKKLLQKFNDYGVVPKKEEAANSRLAGKSFVITGTLSMDREQAAEMVRANGGTFQSSVGKGTDYLVTGQNVGASKLDKARKFDVTIIGEDEFLKLIQ